MSSVEDFFNIINEKTWRYNISSEVEKKFDIILAEIMEYKSEIIAEVVDDIKRIEKVKLEESEEFNYSTFKKWVDRYTRDTIQAYTEEE